MPNINKKIKKNRKNNQVIGVFDSGVGGLSVLRELQHLLPRENFVFLADQKYVPYGEKTKKELIKLAYKITDYFVNYHNIKMMVVACNTSTCNSIGELRKKYSFLIVGTVPAIKLAAENSKSATVAIISTPSTSKSQVLKKLIKDNCQNINVLNISCKNLENVVEKGKLNNAEVKRLLLKYLTEVKDSNTDQLVLGCTHYVFLKKTIENFLGPRIRVIDGNKGIAKQTKSLLLAHLMKNNQRAKGKTLYFSTGNSVKFSKVASKLLKIKVRAKKVAI